MMATSQRTFLDHYLEHGYALLPEAIDGAQLAELRGRLDELLGEDLPGTVAEANTNAIRALHGIHEHDPVFGLLTRSPLLVEAAETLLEDEVYLYQFKINVKAAFEGEMWPWHQDFIFWERLDGMPKPQALNAVVFLEDVTEFNGPILLLDGSQVNGTIEPEQAASGDWHADVSADLSFTLERSQVAALVDRHPIVAPKGRAGSVLLFDPRMVHGSASNMSPHGRAAAILTYNAVSNAPAAASSRPSFLVAADATAIHAEPYGGTASNGK